MSYHESLLLSFLCCTIIVYAQQQPPQCHEINFDSAPNFCKGVGTVKTPALWDPAFSKTFFPANSDAYNQSTTRPKANLADVQQAFEQVFTVEALRTWGQTMFGCADITFLQGRWFRAMTCSAFVSMSNAVCQGSGALICASNAKEFWATWHQAALNPINKCPANVNDRVQTAFRTSSLARAQLNDAQCVNAAALESLDMCGFPNPNQACANSCTLDAFFKAQTLGAGQSTDQWCTSMYDLLNPKPASKVKFLTTADFDASPLASNMVVAPGTNSTANGGANTSSFNQFLNRPIAGVEGRYWIIGAISIVAILLLGSISVYLYRKISGRPKPAPEKGGKDSRGADQHKSSWTSSSFNFNSVGISAMNQAAKQAVPVHHQMTPHMNGSMLQKQQQQQAPRPRTQDLSRRNTINEQIQYHRKAVLSYQPRLDDELQIHQGDIIGVWEEYGDGYAWGETSMGEQGVFPIMCLAPEEPEMHYDPVTSAGIRDTIVHPSKASYRFTAMTMDSDVGTVKDGIRDSNDFDSITHMYDHRTH